jgi:hypothetical protein
MRRSAEKKHSDQPTMKHYNYLLETRCTTGSLSSQARQTDERVKSQGIRPEISPKLMPARPFPRAAGMGILIIE